jgi:DNA-binding MarR family transcriptional regulator
MSSRLTIREKRVGEPVLPAAKDADPDAFWQAWDEFFAALRRARGRAAHDQPGALTHSQYRLLLAVADSPQARCGDLAELVGSSGPTVTRMLTGLESAGAVRRERSTGDRRGVTVVITEAGRAMLEAKSAVVRDKRAAFYESLTPAERAQAEQLLRRFADAFEVL